MTVLLPISCSTGWLHGQEVQLSLIHIFAVEKNATNAQISLAWMLHKYPNVVPIPGSKNQERILENLGAWNVTLSGDEFRQLQSALDECKEMCIRDSSCSGL